MADTTYADALAKLRAECGEPTGEGDASGMRLAWWTSAGRKVRLWEVDREVWLTTCDGGLAPQCYVLAGDAPLTPLDVAARDAGAWLRGRG